jgi:outer membrane protein assembly factor BamB
VSRRAAHERVRRITGLPPRWALLGLALGLLVAGAGVLSADRKPDAEPAPASAPVRSSSPPTPASPSPVASSGSIHVTGAGVLLIADRGNGRLLMVDRSHQVVWRFPVAGSLPKGQKFAADDAFIAPDGRTIVANDESHEVIDRIDIVTRRVVWQYGHYDEARPAAGWLHTPDDAYPLANGDVDVADIRNCRLLEIDAAKRIVHSWGRPGACVDRPPTMFAEPNGDTPLPDGGLLVTEITGSRVVRLSPDGRVVFDIHVPVAYPSDAQLDSSGDVLVVDYSKPGAIVRVDPTGRVLWRYSPTSGSGRLDHPSLAIPLPDGTIALNDDFRHRVVVIDPAADRIVWQYGATDRPGSAAGRLDTPDGIDPIPSGIRLP